MPTAQHIALLLYRELEGKLSETENRELQAWKTENPEHTRFLDDLLDEDKLTALIKLHHPENKETVKHNILTKMEDQLEFKVIPFYKRSFFRVAVAACIAVLITVGGYFMLFNKQGEQPPIAKTTNDDVQAPASNKAVITLPDGKMISLDTLTTYTQGSVTVTKTADGRLVYTGFGSEVKFNTLTNPRGSKVIDLTLSDGTHVWLNSGTSLYYPVSFVGKDREVAIEGEAYFEVAKDAKRPFKVVSRGLTTEVLGTHFNVNNYEDEDKIRVTLIEGSVKVYPLGAANGPAAIKLKPGQQAEAKSIIELNESVNIDAVMAWKNGNFSFNNTDLRSIMRQVMRWYDVDIVYEGKVPDRFFTADISRDKNLSAMLKILELSNVHFRVEGRKLIVMP